MNDDTLQDRWKQLAGKVRAQWGKLTEDDLTLATGTREHLEGALQGRYGSARDAAKRPVREFAQRL